MVPELQEERETLTRPYTPCPSQGPIIVVKHRNPPVRNEAHTCHGESGAHSEVEGRIIIAQLQKAVVKPARSLPQRASLSSPRVGRTTFLYLDSWLWANGIP